MHKVQAFSAAKRFEVTFRPTDYVAELWSLVQSLAFIGIRIGVQDRERGHSLEAKYGIIKIAFAGAVFETSILIDLGHEESASKLCGIAEDLAREPSHLQHFQTKAHRC